MVEREQAKEKANTQCKHENQNISVQLYKSKLTLFKSCECGKNEFEPIDSIIEKNTQGKCLEHGQIGNKTFCTQKRSFKCSKCLNENENTKSIISFKANYGLLPSLTCNQHENKPYIYYCKTDGYSQFCEDCYKTIQNNPKMNDEEKQKILDNYIPKTLAIPIEPTKEKIEQANTQMHLRNEKLRTIEQNGLEIIQKYCEDMKTLLTGICEKSRHFNDDFIDLYKLFIEYHDLNKEHPNDDLSELINAFPYQIENYKINDDKQYTLFELFNAIKDEYFFSKKVKYDITRLSSLPHENEIVNSFNENNYKFNETLSEYLAKKQNGQFMTNKNNFIYISSFNDNTLKSSFLINGKDLFKWSYDEWNNRLYGHDETVSEDDETEYRKLYISPIPKPLSKVLTIKNVKLFCIFPNNKIAYVKSGIRDTIFISDIKDNIQPQFKNIDPGTKTPLVISYDSYDAFKESNQKIIKLNEKRIKRLLWLKNDEIVCVFKGDTCEIINTYNQIVSKYCFKCINPDQICGCKYNSLIKLHDDTIVFNQSHRIHLWHKKVRIIQNFKNVIQEIKQIRINLIACICYNRLFIYDYKNRFLQKIIENSINITNIYVVGFELVFMSDDNFQFDINDWQFKKTVSNNQIVCTTNGNQKVIIKIKFEVN